jgi:crotonobetainyl-CoA:carnitine CoA-transferase CaiB-like acyl-CoA transferase
MRPKISTHPPFGQIPDEGGETWSDWIREADDPATNHLKPEALDDLMVLDVSHGSMAGLFCSSLLGEFGAEVIRIEPPEGDVARRFTPFGRLLKGTGLGYLVEGRNKFHITLNLETEEAREAFKRLASRADVVIESFAPGVMDGYGLSYRCLREINPGLVYASVTSYGHFGPEAGSGKPNSDLIDQARSGVMAVTGEPAEEGEPPRAWNIPTKQGNWMGWYAGGAWTAFGVLAALHHRRAAGGEGQMVDVAPGEAELRFCDYHLQYYHVTEKLRGLVGAYDSAVFPYTIVKTRDGHSFIAGFSDPNWEGLTNIMENPELRRRFPTIFDRLKKANQPLIHREIEKWSIRWSCDEILAKVQDYVVNRRGPGTVATAKMTDVRETFGDETWWRRGVFEKGADPFYGDIAFQAPPWKMTLTPARVKWICRPVGADNSHIFQKYLGLGPEKIEEWRGKNIA